MPRFLLVALTLVVFILAMAAWGWVVDASVPTIHAWLVERLGSNGVTVLLVAIVVGAGSYAYLGGKPKGT